MNISYTFLLGLIFGVYSLAISISPSEMATFTDPRDGHTYNLISVENDIWLAEDLRYPSDKVYMHIRKKEKDTLFLYGLQERDKVCPAPFHLMRKSELDRALVTFYGLTEEQMDTTSWGDPQMFRYFDADSLFTADSGLHFKKKGWVQGKRYRKRASENTIHLWVDHDNDQRYHMHMADTNAFVHAHDHHLLEGPRKQRKFSIRCVCQREDLSNYLD